MINFAFRDIFVNLAAIFLLIALLLTPNKKEDDEQKDKIEAQGELIVMMSWPAGYDRDIDLWVMHPGDESAVGWSNKGDTNCNLLRDDLGDRPDIDPLAGFNQEMIQCRRMLVGEYIINIHFYGGTGKDQRGSIPVEVVAHHRIHDKFVLLNKQTYVLGAPGDWRTMFRFLVDESGQITDQYYEQYGMHFNRNVEGDNGP